MRFAYLLPVGACTHHCCISEGLVVLRDHTNRVCGVASTMYRREQGPRCFGRKAHQRPTCAWGRPGAIHRVARPGAWPLRGIPCEGLQQELGGSLSASRYLSKNTRVVDVSLHLYLIFTFRIYIANLVVCFTSLA